METIIGVLFGVFIYFVSSRVFLFTGMQELLFVSTSILVFVAARHVFYKLKASESAHR